MVASSNKGAKGQREVQKLRDIVSNKQSVE